MDDPIGKFLGKGNVICHVQTSAVGDAAPPDTLIPNPRVLIDRR